jgi:protocatechuate 3,4-dioxygenase beta subunit
VRRPLLLVLCLPTALSAQVVRGVVRDSASGDPAAGVLVALLQRGTGERRTVLTDEEGRFTIAAPGPGSYSLETKRIGVRPVVSPEFTLGAGEARELSTTVAPVVALLDAVRVTGRSYCGARVSQGAETATLWEEVRAALTATRLTREARGFPVTITSFKRTLDPASFEVRAEERSERSGVTSNPFMSAPLASLSAHGYIVSEGSTLQYRGPDVDVLLSDTFVRDHCFRAVLGTSQQMGLLGLSFEPTSARKLPDIAGVLWIDARTHELRRLEYQYTRSPLEIHGRLPLSYMDFARLPSGAWIVQRWAIRMPHAKRVGAGDAPTNPLVVADPPRNRLIAVLEEGGEAVVGERQTSRAAYVVQGTVFDSSAGKPLPGARVSLRGTPFNATADAAGRFRIQLPDTGSYMLVFDHPRLDSLGFEVRSRGIRVAGGLTTADVAVPPLALVRSALCPGSRAPDRTGIVHGTVRNSAGAAMSWATIRYRWAQYAVVAANRQSPLPAASSVPVTASAPDATFVTDSRGRYLICDVPPGRYRLTLESETDDVAQTDVFVDAGELVLREMTLRRR